MNSEHKPPAQASITFTTLPPSGHNLATFNTASCVTSREPPVSDDNETDAIGAKRYPTLV